MNQELADLDGSGARRKQKGDPMLELNQREITGLLSRPNGKGEQMEVKALNREIIIDLRLHHEKIFLLH